MIYDEYVYEFYLFANGDMAPNPSNGEQGT